MLEPFFPFFRNFVDNLKFPLLNCKQIWSAPFHTNLWYFPMMINFEYCMILCARMVFRLCQQDYQFFGAILVVWTLGGPMITVLPAWIFHYDIDSKVEVAIILWNFYSQLEFVLKRGGRCARKRRQSEVTLCWKVV